MRVAVVLLVLCAACTGRAPARTEETRGIDDAGVTDPADASDVDAGEPTDGGSDAGPACEPPFAADDDARCAAWLPVAPMATHRCGAAFVDVGGRIFAIGGERCAFEGNPGNDVDERALALVEEFDVAARAWQRRADMNVVRQEPIAVALDGSRVLVVGGIAKSGGEGSTQVSAEIYDVVGDAWTPIPAPPSSHVLGTASVLEDGRVLFAGGYVDEGDVFSFLDATTAVSIYDPIGNAWTTRSPLPAQRLGHAAVLVDDRVLLVGGNTIGRLNGPDLLPGTFLYDVEGDVWTTLPEMSVGRWKPSLISRDDGRVLVAGGSFDASTEIISVNGAASTDAASTNEDHVEHGTVIRETGVMLFGGTGGAPSDPAGAEELREGIWHPLLPPPLLDVDARIFSVHAIAVSGGSVLVVRDALTGNGLPAPNNAALLYSTALDD